MVKVLFVCMGNICRSPTAHGVFSGLVREQGLEHLIEVDSAGTHAYHIGNCPDPRTQQIALKRGVDLSQLRARRVQRGDFARFDYILAMDEENIENLAPLCPAEFRDKLKLFLEFAPELNQREVPDPYYGGTSGFERVLYLVEAASVGLLEDIRHRHGSAIGNARSG